MISLTPIFFLFILGKRKGQKEKNGESNQDGGDRNANTGTQKENTNQKIKGEIINKIKKKKKRTTQRRESF